jgi:hypothetical protein
MHTAIVFACEFSAIYVGLRVAAWCVDLAIRR